MRNATSQHATRPASGFTAIELCLAMVITALVMGAVAAFSLAMSTTWKSAEKSQAITVLGNQIAARIQSEVRKARLIGASRAGSSDGSASGAAVLLWMQDNNVTGGDGYIQGSEVELIEHDPTSHTLRIWPAGQSDATGTWSYSAKFTATSTINDFKQNRQWHKMAGGVYGAIFQTTGTGTTSLNPSLSFSLKLMVDDSQAGASSTNAIGGDGKLMVDYGTATLRAPGAQPTN